VHQLCHWELQAKRPDSDVWVTLHRSDVPLDPSPASSPYAEGYFPLQPSLGDRFQVFRVAMTGENSSGQHFLFCSGLELYGTLFY
jgi:hypothetical protein